MTDGTILFSHFGNYLQCVLVVGVFIFVFRKCLFFQLFIYLVSHILGAGFIYSYSLVFDKRCFLYYFKFSFLLFHVLQISSQLILEWLIFVHFFALFRFILLYLLKLLFILYFRSFHSHVITGLLTILFVFRSFYHSYLWCDSWLLVLLLVFHLTHL